MKLAIVFEVPDGTHADAVKVMIERYALSEQGAINHWLFDLAMRPVGAIAIQPDTVMASAVAAAMREINQDSPWIPGGVFRADNRLKPLLLDILNLLM